MDLFDFIEQSPNPYFAVKTMSGLLQNNGFTRLFEGERWSLSPGKYFVTRDDSSLIAFVIPRTDFSGFQILASHCDSPAFKVKSNPLMAVENAYFKLNTEKYGGMILSTWFDRPLSLAGRLMLRTKDGIKTKLLKIDRDLLLIPSLAIHMDRTANDGHKYDPQKELLPLFSLKAAVKRDDDAACDVVSGVNSDVYDNPDDSKKATGLSANDEPEIYFTEYINKSSGEKEHPKLQEKPMVVESYSNTHDDRNIFIELLADCAGVLPEEIIDSDLFLYNREKPVFFGADEEFIAAPRLDDLQCAYASLMGFITAEPKEHIAVHAVFNNEEVGSQTKQGAASSFLTDVLSRINASLGYDDEDFRCRLSSSFLISADNAHALHPNYPEKADPTNKPVLNGGIVIKYNANQHYTTDAVSATIFREICKKADVPVQEFVNRSDIAGGSTLGSIAITRLSMNTVDIGLPQLAMHSAFETAGASDTAYLIRAANTFFSTTVKSRGDGNYTLI